LGFFAHLFTEGNEGNKGFLQGLFEFIDCQVRISDHSTHGGGIYFTEDNKGKEAFLQKVTKETKAEIFLIFVCFCTVSSVCSGEDHSAYSVA